MGQAEVGTPVGTTQSVRVAAMLLYALALVVWVAWVGLPKQPIILFAWFWLATIAWNLQAPWRSHLGFLRDWWIPLAVLTLYLYSRGLADELGFGTVHVTEPIDVD